MKNFGDVATNKHIVKNLTGSTGSNCYVDTETQLQNVEVLFVDFSGFFDMQNVMFRSTSSTNFAENIRPKHILGATFV